MADHSFTRPSETSAVPVAERLPSPPEAAPEAEFPIAAEGLPGVGAIPPPPWKLCLINLREGCYRITFRPSAGFYVYRGTMRVEKSGASTTVSGDLYRFLSIVFPFPATGVLAAALDPALTGVEPTDAPMGIPIYGRNRYYSYLKVTSVRKSPVLTSGPCHLTLTIDEYVYNQPPAGSFNGTFAAAPARTVTVVLSHASPPLGFISSYFEGKLYEGGVEKGTFTMAWVSSYFRRATLQVSCVPNAVAPAAVPALSGGGNEDFRTVFATAKWDVSAFYDAAPLAIPAGTTTLVPGVCPSSADLHALMMTIHTPGPHLDQDWRMHLLVVPGKMSCGRGVMFDMIGAHREGVASFCDDGYPSSHSANFGVAENKKQREIPRAFLRSASHEAGHGFNQIHQEQEGGADNSIMTTTPSVADVLGGPATGEPGVFPDNIRLGFNGHVRHHLIHFPDPVVRPGGMNFGAGHSTVVPQADQDRFYLPEDIALLKLEMKSGRVKLGEPLPLSWEFTNKTKEAIRVPSDVSLDGQYAHISVTNPNGVSRYMPSFIIRTDRTKLQDLEPAKKLSADTHLFWSSNGFAFETPGKHRIELRIVWTDGGIPYGAKATADIWVDHPATDADNEVASLLLHDEVGMFVALGGDARHLKEAVSRLNSAASAHPEHPASAYMAEFRGHKGSATKKK